MDNIFIGNDKRIDSKPPVTVASWCDIGMVRNNNEDYHGFFIPKDNLVTEKMGCLFAVSDGVGGSAGGEVASAEAVNVLLQEYYFGRYSERGPDRLKSSFQYTARHIYDLSSRSYRALANMKCTLSALLIKRDRYFIVHVGDSKIFLLRNNRILQLTKDHSLVGKLVRLGFVSEEQARQHPNRHVLLKALGDQPILSSDYYTGKLQRGDKFCLITDGITEHMTVNELSIFLNGDISEEGLKALCEEINSRGGHDNMTIMIATVHEVI